MFLEDSSKVEEGAGGGDEGRGGGGDGEIEGFPTVDDWDEERDDEKRMMEDSGNGP